jgi:hypothetical protein
MEHSPKCSDQVKKEWSCTSIPPICLHGVRKENIVTCSYSENHVEHVCTLCKESFGTC